MSAQALPLAKVGTLVQDVDTWNPSREGRGRQFHYIDLGSVDGEQKCIFRSQYLAGEDAPTRARQRVRTDDVLVSTVRPNLNGVARVPPQLDGATASTGFCVLRCKPELDPGYLFNWVRTQSFVREMTRRATGQSYPAVSDKIVRDSEIPLPPLREQRRLAEILDEADCIRQRRRAATMQLELLSSSIFESLFGDPVTNPLGWATDRLLGQVAEIVSGVTKGRRLKGQTTRLVPYLAVANVQDGHLNLGNLKTIEATPAEIERFRLSPGDLLLTEGGDPDKLGRGALWSGEISEAIHQNHVFRVRLKDLAIMDPVFLNAVVSSQRGKLYFLQAAKQTTGIASINAGQLKNFPLLVPPIDLQRQFAQAVGRLELLRGKLVQHAEALDTLFASLQYRAFAGKL